MTTSEWDSGYRFGVTEERRRVLDILRELDEPVDIVELFDLILGES